MAAFSYGIIAWAFWSIALKSTKVRAILCFQYSNPLHHLGPVRGVAFHPSRPLLVTGGDDYKIRIWGAQTSSVMVMDPC